MTNYMNKENTFNGQCICEELFNSISHGLGAALAIAGTTILIIFASIYSDALCIVGCSLYGAALTILYCNSTLYHSFTNYKVKSIFQIFDHCSIFLLIWGTYVPIALSLIGGVTGWVLFGVQTICAILGIVLKSVDFRRWKNFSLVLYIVMGWCVVANTKIILPIIDKTGLIFLLGGGIFYTVGVYFYKKKEKFLSHFIWHLFVLAGSIMHYFFILQYCI